MTLDQTKTDRSLRMDHAGKDRSPRADRGILL